MLNRIVPRRERLEASVRFFPGQNNKAAVFDYRRLRFTTAKLAKLTLCRNPAAEIYNSK